jgi:hypothetical protein
MNALYQDLSKGGLWLPCKLVDYDIVRDKNADSHAIDYEGEVFGVFASEVKLTNEKGEQRWTILR